MPGVLVSLGGVDATDVVRASDYFITATAPAHDPGMVDVVVTNPGGQRAALPGGFSYPGVSPVPDVTVSLTVTPSTVTAGGQLRVIWATPQSGRSPLDWIGIFRVGDSNFNYLDYQTRRQGRSASDTVKI